MEPHAGAHDLGVRGGRGGTVDTSRRVPARRITEVKRGSISSVEMHILNQFIMIHKVFNEVIEDLSRLNRVGSQRIATKKPDEAATLRANEKSLEKKINEKIVFAVVSLEL